MAWNSLAQQVDKQLSNSEYALYNTYMLKYSEVNRTNEKQQEYFFKQLQNLFLQH